MKNKTKNSCADFGMWLAHAPVIERMMNAKKDGLDIKSSFGDNSREQEFEIISNGIAIIPIIGMMVKGFSFFSDASTLDIRKQLKIASENQDVKAILLLIDSPGGHVAGTKELADDIAKIDKIKPVFAQIDDLGASASYWVASQARKIFANATAEIGSIGVLAVIHDTSKMFEDLGVKVRVVSTGDMKGAFTDGTEVTDIMIADLQERINGINEFFLNAVMRGRGLTREQLMPIATGAVFLAKKAMKLGLIDSINTTEKTLDIISKEIRLNTRMQRAEHLKTKLDALSVQSHE